MVPLPPSASPGVPLSIDGDGPSQANVLSQLDKILASASFQASPQLSRFLRYAVECTAHGEGDLLKEYRLGIDVIGRPPSYDPRKDPVVRLEARRLRAKLREYYESEGRQDAIRIDIPKGGYAAAFASVNRPNGVTTSIDAETNLRPDDYPNQTKSAFLEGAARVRIWSRRVRLGIASAATVMALLGGWGVYRILARRGSSTGEINSVAVLPLQNATGNLADDYIVDGVTDDLIANLSRLPGLRVIAHGTVFRYKGSKADPKQIGRDLRAATVLSGRVLERGDTITLEAELIDIANGRELWSGQYNRKLTDIRSMQQTFSQEVAMAIRPPLGGDETVNIGGKPAQNTEAYLLYLKGRYSWNKRTEAGFSKAIDYFNQAIEKDASYAPAYAGVADGYMLLAEYLTLPADTALPKARQAALKALELDQNLGEAHASLGAISADQWQWEEAEREIRRAIELEPSYATAHQWYAELLCEQGRHDEAMVEIKTAQELDPLSPIINSQMARVQLFSGQPDAAIEQLKKTLEIEPGFSVADYYLGKAYLRKGQAQRAVAELEKATRQYRVSEWDAFLAYADAQAGHGDEARRILHRYLEDSEGTYVSWYGIAVLYSGLADSDHAFVCLEKAYRQHDPRLREMKVDPFLQNLHSDPRFTQLLLRIGLG